MLKKYLILLGLLVSLDQKIVTGKPKLIDYAYNIYSQFGEDGMIEKIFEIIGDQSKVCVEFGAWDGLHFSNAANLWLHKGWRAILIEPHEQRYAELVKNTRNYACITIQEFVGKDSQSLEAIFRKYSINTTIDLLSIDIDGNDYYVFEAIESLRPRLIICEYNPTFPAMFDLYPEYDNCMGCSAGALVRIAKSKGYCLVALTDTNCFFIRDEDLHKFVDFEIDLEKIKIDKYLTYVVSNYAGQYCWIGGVEQLPYGARKRFKPKLKSDMNKFSMVSQ